MGKPRASNRPGRTGGAPRLFAVVPAAGESRRMGRPKLLLPLGGRTVLARLLEACHRPGIAACAVVVRPGDEELASLAEGRALLVRPDVPPPDMLASVKLALAAIRAQFAPQSRDGWMLVPADHPVLDPSLIDRLIAAWQAQPEARILVPVCGSRRGHPTFFRWDLAAEVSTIPEGQGLNRLLRRRPQDVLEFPVESPAVLTDLDTPEDYETLRQAFP